MQCNSIYRTTQGLSILQNLPIKNYTHIYVNRLDTGESIQIPSDSTKVLDGSELQFSSKKEIKAYLNSGHTLLLDNLNELAFLRNGEIAKVPYERISHFKIGYHSSPNIIYSPIDSTKLVDKLSLWRFTKLPEYFV